MRILLVQAATKAGSQGAGRKAAASTIVESEARRNYINIPPILQREESSTLSSEQAFEICKRQRLAGLYDVSSQLCADFLLTLAQGSPNT